MKNTGFTWLFASRGQCSRLRKCNQAHYGCKSWEVHWIENNHDHRRPNGRLPYQWQHPQWRKISNQRTKHEAGTKQLSINTECEKKVQHEENRLPQGELQRHLSQFEQ